MPSAHLFNHVPDDLGVEQRLLLRLVRRHALGSRLEARELAVLSDRELAEDFFALATRHGVQGLALWQLAHPGDPPLVPPDIVARARGTLRALRSEAVLWDLERDRVIGGLVGRGLTPVALKGAALRRTAYSDPVQRSMTDIDLLVASEEVDEAVETLKGLGYHTLYSDAAVDAYRRHHFHIRLSTGEFLVEVHWGLTRSGRPFRLDAAPILRRSMVCERPNRPALRVPSPEDMILHMVSQNLDDGTRLGRLVDIDRVLDAAERVEWDYLRESARASGLQVALAVMLRLCETLLGTPIPAGQLERLGVTGGTRFHLALMRPLRWALSPSPDRLTVNEVRLFWCTAGWRRRLQLLRQLLSKREDPLKWVWEKWPGRIGNAAPVGGATSLVKALAYQGWLYLHAGATCLTRAGRRDFRFWS